MVRVLGKLNSGPCFELHFGRCPRRNLCFDAVLSQTCILVLRFGFAFWIRILDFWWGFQFWDAEVLSDCAGLLLQLRKLQSNLAFPPVLVSRALEAVAREKAEAWRFSPEDCKEFAKDVEGRIRGMCRHWMAAERKANKPKWFLRIRGCESTQMQLVDLA